MKKDVQFSALQIFIFITCTAAAARHSISIANVIPRRSHIRIPRPNLQMFPCRTPIKSSFSVSQESRHLFAILFSFFVCQSATPTMPVLFAFVAVVSECSKKEKHNIPRLLLSILLFLCFPILLIRNF